MFAKTDVNGANTEPLWAYLKDQQGGMLTSDIKWNFRCGGGGGGLGGVGRRAGGRACACACFAYAMCGCWCLLLARRQQPANNSPY